MLRMIAAVLLLWPAAGTLWAQEPDAASSGAKAAQPSAESLLQSFQNADPAGKVKMLTGQAAHPSAAMGPFYRGAAEYLATNLSVLRNTADGEKLALLSVKLIGAVSYAAATDSVWQLFQFSYSTPVRVAALETLATVAKGNEDVINKMNHWLNGQNLLHETGTTVDTQVVDGCVRALGTLGDASSFQVLFAAMEAGYEKPVTEDARAALAEVKGDRARQLLQLVETARYSDRPAALEMALSSQDLGVADKGKIATAALKAALTATDSGQDVRQSLTLLRFRAADAIASLDWSPAAPLILDNFNRTATEYASGSVPADDMVVAAIALAAMGTHEAAVRLSLYLDLINSMTQKGRPPDQSVVLAVVKGLGKLGDPVAYDGLDAMRYLDYTDSVKAAASEAVRDLTNR